MLLLVSRLFKLNPSILVTTTTKCFSPSALQWQYATTDYGRNSVWHTCLCCSATVLWKPTTNRAPNTTPVGDKLWNVGLYICASSWSDSHLNSLQSCQEVCICCYHQPRGCISKTPYATGSSTVNDPMTCMHAVK